MTNRVLRLYLSALACVAVAGLPGCNNKAGSAPAPPIAEVAVMTVTAQTIPDEPEFIGQAEASRIVEIRSQVTGIIKERFFREGREVKMGERLYQIDPVPFQAAALSAKAKVTQAEARLVQAQQNLDRVKPLLTEQAVSQKDVDDAVAEKLAGEAALEEAKAELVKAQFDLDNTLITAPINGVIERTRVNEGRLVSAQTDLLTTIHQVNPMYVSVSVPESYLLRRRKQLAAKQVQRPDIYQLKGIITFADGTTYPREGVLDFADVVLRTETGALQGRFVFPNSAKGGSTDPAGVLLPGQFLKVR
ncbi:MAG: efflux RND transporter periplasmic adaptor subunit, partial [Acidobacteria bacterium]|nr:efflux RND transporter periplasmic adaptor subunit [Acidobacteriota bacterium]